jgi:hypothetical protein
VKYRAYGLVVESQQPVEELTAVELHEADAFSQISIEWAGPAPTLPDPGDAPPPLPDVSWPRTERDSDGYRVSFSDEAEFWVAADGRTIRCFQSSAPLPSVRHWLLDHVLPRALDLWGLSPLHATAIATTEGVLAFLGATGTGKSTLAATLTALGAELVSDDCLVLEQRGGSIIAVPSYPGLRLHEDVLEALDLQAALRPVAHYTAKQRLTETVPLAREHRPLLAVYVLSRSADSGAPEFEALRPADATMALAGSAFRMDVERREQHRQQLQFFAEVARRVPVRRCSYGDDLAGLRTLANGILTEARSAARKPRR